MVKAVIFDLWGTIVENGVHPSPSKQVRYFLRTRAQFSEFITVFESSFMTKKFDSLQAAFEQVAVDFNIKLPDFVYEKLVGMWNKNAILSKLFPETEEILNKLKEQGYKLFLLANIDQFSYEQIKTKFDLDKYFDKIYLSYETGFLKVDKQAYDQVLSENKLKQKDVVMVGDSLDSDMKTAQNAGIKGILLDRRETREFDGPRIKTLEELPVILKD